MSFGLTIPNLSRAADSIVPGSLAMRRVSTCREALERRMESISEVIRPYSRDEAFSSALDRIITVEHIPRVAISIIAKKIHDGSSRNQSTVAGSHSRDSSRTGSVGSACVGNLLCYVPISKPVSISYPVQGTPPQSRFNLSLGFSSVLRN